MVERSSSVDTKHATVLPRITAFAALMLACLFAGCGGGARAAIESHRTDASKRYESRDFVGAIAEYEEILRIEPKYGQAHFQIANIYDHNLNDYLNASYHYQRFLQSDNPDIGKAELAKGFLENAKVQFAASVPNVGAQNSPELVKLRSENSALHRQVDDLKREIVRSRTKVLETSGRRASAKAALPAPTDSPTANPVPATPAGAHVKTYTVHKGENILAIAEKVYGNRARWKDIVAANPQLKDPNRLAPGQVLKMP